MAITFKLLKYCNHLNTKQHTIFIQQKRFPFTPIATKMSLDLFPNSFVKEHAHFAFATVTYPRGASQHMPTWNECSIKCSVESHHSYRPRPSHELTRFSGPRCDNVESNGSTNLFLRTRSAHFSCLWGTLG